MSNLVISRKIDQPVIVAHDGKILRMTIIDIDRNRVRIAFEAGHEFEIYREEIAPAALRCADEERDGEA